GRRRPEGSPAAGPRQKNSSPAAGTARRRTARPRRNRRRIAGLYAGSRPAISGQQLWGEVNIHVLTLPVKLLLRLLAAALHPKISVVALLGSPLPFWTMRRFTGLL